MEPDPLGEPARDQRDARPADRLPLLLPPERRHLKVLLWLHLVAASVWLGGLVTLGLAAVVALRTLEREQFRAFIRPAGRGFAVVSAAAWLVLGASGLALAAQHGWSHLLVAKTVLAVLVVLMAGAHVLLGARTASRTAIVASRSLAVLILAATLLIYWMGVNLG